MDASLVTQLIGSLGFPIACCVALFWYMTKQAQQHKEEMQKMADAINNNTAVLQSLLDKIRDLKGS